MKNLFLTSLFGLSLLIFGCNKVKTQPTSSASSPANPIVETTMEQAKVQVAILLDASNSMDGLIEQAKSRLWNIVNTITSLKFNGQEPLVEIALYMYGNDGLSERDNYIKQILPFTTDLDLISEKLFAIKTNGGSEYCGAVIDHAVKKLDWGNKDSYMKLIYIAGNEPFTQGKISYIEAANDAVNKEIFINTIHCGNCDVGINDKWKDGAEKGKGKYFCINSDAKVMYVETPYDSDITKYNEQLNGTYIYYGQVGYSKYANQSAQDNNAIGISQENLTERAVSKSKSVYNNESWDLVDKINADTTYVNKLDMKTLPEEYKNLSKEELTKELEKKTAEREQIKKNIQDLSVKRQAYINNELKNKTTEDDFGAAVNKSIVEIAKIKGFKI
ncbi:MAG: VWA domain-containing protein [Bacteroidales bacterium]|nr:VWA domain-containing protein [Bacteroidales bacterium]